MDHSGGLRSDAAASPPVAGMGSHAARSLDPALYGMDQHGDRLPAHRTACARRHVQGLHALHREHGADPAQSDGRRSVRRIRERPHRPLPSLGRRDRSGERIRLADRRMAAGPSHGSLSCLLRRVRQVESRHANPFIRSDCRADRGWNRPDSGHRGRPVAAVRTGALADSERHAVDAAFFVSDPCCRVHRRGAQGRNHRHDPLRDAAHGTACAYRAARGSAGDPRGWADGRLQCLANALESRDPGRAGIPAARRQPGDHAMPRNGGHRLLRRRQGLRTRLAVPPSGAPHRGSPGDRRCHRVHGDHAGPDHAGPDCAGAAAWPERTVLAAAPRHCRRDRGAGRVHSHRLRISCRRGVSAGIGIDHRTALGRDRGLHHAGVLRRPRLHPRRPAGERADPGPDGVPLPAMDCDSRPGRSGRLVHWRPPGCVRGGRFFSYS